MLKQKYRTIEELYSVTKPILELEITPVLRGSCRMQGPVSETDEHSCLDKVLSQAGKEAGCHSTRHKAPMLAESGTCNLCSAPCSSCMDLHRNHKRLKTEDFPKEICHRHIESQYSINEADGYSVMKSRECDDLQRTSSETSNILSATSSHDSISENVVNKAKLRYSDISCASEDVEMCPKSELVDVPNMAMLPNKFENIKRIECGDDESSSASGANDANIRISLVPSASSNKVCSKMSTGAADLNFDVVERHRNLRRQTSYIEDSKQKVSLGFLSAQVANQFGPSYPISKDDDTGCSSPKVHSTYSHPESRQSPTFTFKEELSSIREKKWSDVSVRHMDSLLKKEETSTINCFQKSDRIDNLQNNERSPLGGSSDVFRRVDLKSEAEINHSSGYMSDDALKWSGKNEQAMTSNLDDETELHDSAEPRLQSTSEDKNDESDIVEVDVNICDICGDAGREYLLAVCSKCGDGAEHTYCMREKLEEVPKGEWLCEECKLNVESKNKKREVEAVNASAKKQCTGYTRSVRKDLYVKLNSKDIAANTKRSDTCSPSTHIFRKRPFDSLGADSGVKRLVLETNAGSPKVQSPSRTSLAKGSLYKNPDRGKVKLARQMSFVPATTSPRFQTARGSLLKSNSFNSFNNKPRVVADDVVHHKQKATRELGSLESKEGRLKLMKRSISLKPENSVRSSALDSKGKMLSPRFSHSQYIKGLGKEKDWNTLERKKSFKLDGPVTSLARASSTVSARQGDKDFTSRIDPTAGNQRVSKLGQVESKFASSNPTRSLARNALEIPVGGISSKGMHGAASAKEKSNLVSPKEEVIGRTSHNTKKSSRANVVDTVTTVGGISSKVMRGAASSEEKSNLVSPKEEVIGSYSHNTKKSPRANVVDTVMSFSRESENQVERTGDNLTPRPGQGDRIASPPASCVDPSDTRSSKDAVKNGSTLKDAIHAALLKKPGIYKNSRAPADQSDGVSLSKTDSNLGVASQEKLAISSIFKSINTGELEGKPIVTGNISDTCIQTKSRKQLTVYPTDHVMSTFLQTVPIPEHEYIWQGDFEVLRNGKVPELCAGIQAHLSTCASPRVLEVVNKCASRVPLTEVSRKSIWPAQFHDCGPREDHIALYFFAKDVASYEMTYMSLLDGMMKNDVALKGSIDGVELLIYSSNHLPKKSQRWNTLFFLWGVFRAKKASCSDDDMADHSNLDIVRLDKESPTAVTSLSDLSEKLCSPRYTDPEVTGRNKVSDLVLDSHTNGSLGIIAGNGESTPSSLGHMFSGSQGKSEQPDSRLNSQTLAGVQIYSRQLCTESGHKTSQEPNTGEDCKLETELLPPTRETLSPVNIHTISLQQVDHNVKLSTREVSDRLSDTVHMKTERCMKNEEGSDTKIFPEKNTTMRDLSPNEDRKHPHFPVIASQASPGCKSEETAIKILKVEQTQSSKSDSCINLNALPEDSGSSCLQKCAEAWDLNLTKSSEDLRKCAEGWDLNLTKSSEDLTIAERQFFPIASHLVKEFRMGQGSSIPWVSNGSHHDSLQNVDLALWVDTKLPEQETPVLPLFPDTPNHRPQDDDNSPVSLSLSLAFPLAENKKPDDNAASKIKRGHHVNTPFLLFKDFSNK